MTSNVNSGPSVTTTVNTTASMERIGPTYLGGDISVTLANGNNNNLTVQGFDTCNIVKMTPDAGGSTITGLAGGSAQRYVILSNLSDSVSIVLAHHSASSLPENRIHCPGAADLTLLSNASAALWFDADHGHWRVLSWS